MDQNEPIFAHVISSDIFTQFGETSMDSHLTKKWTLKFNNWNFNVKCLVVIKDMQNNNRLFFINNADQKRYIKNNKKSKNKNEFNRKNHKQQHALCHTTNLGV